MLKVIIADDEAKVCQLICHLVDWEAFGMEIVDVVNDGKSALESIRINRPEVVITDIRMPGYDGIELIEKVREQYAGVYFVIISGYSQFEYAKQAIKFGVENYLLKPLKKKELETTLNRILEKYNEVNQAASEKENLMERLQESEKKYKKNLIKDLMEQNGGHDIRSDLEQLNKEYGCCFKEGRFVGAAIRPFLLQRGKQERQIYELLLNKINQILEARLPSVSMEAVSAVYQDEVICVINMEEDHMTSVKKELNRLRLEVINWKEIFERVEAVVGIGRIKERPEELADSVREADSALLNRMFYHTNGMITYEDNGRAYDGKYMTGTEMRSRILGCFERLDLDGLLGEIGNIEAQWEKYMADGTESDGEIGRQSFECYKVLTRVLLFGAGNFMPETEFEEEGWFLQKYRTAYTLSEVYGGLKDYLTERFSQHFEKRKNTSIMPIRQAKQYIAEHYNTNLNLEDVSRLVGFNPAYFSSLFKKETGKNFTEYITEIRIGNAKDMIIRSNRDIADIADEVGYTDLKYFSKVFKKVTGVSPSDYRKLYG